MTKERFYLYKACKYQVANFYYDHGMSLVEMWKFVNSDDDLGFWWKREVLKDYEEENS